MPVKQARSRATRDKIIAALEDLLKEKTLDQILMTDLAERASVSIGAIYRRFENKDALLPVVFDIYREKFNGAVNQLKIEPEWPLRKALKAIAHGTLKITREHAHLLKTIHLFSRMYPDKVPAETEELMEKTLALMFQQYEAYLTSKADEIKRTDFKTAARMLGHFLNAIFVEAIIHRDQIPGKGLGLDDEIFADQVADMAYGYLQVPDK